MRGHASSRRQNKNPMSSSAPQLREEKRRAMAQQRQQQREGAWDSSPHAIVPEYSSELDPHCPRAVVREYNRTKKLNAIERSKKGKGASDWIENTIKKKFEDIPIREVPTLREKAVALAAIEKESVAEVDILQSIIIRENLLKELENLLRNQSDVDSVVNEAAEIVKAVRFQTLDIVEAVFSWKSKQKSPTRQFFYRGQNYLLKMMEDTSFLDQFDELGEHFGFYFSGNPLLYSGVPENEMPSLLNESVDKQQLFKPSAVDRNANLIDGISESRIRAAENIVFKEQAMVQEGGAGGGRGPTAQNQSLAIGEGNMYESVVGDAFAGGTNSFVNDTTQEDNHTQRRQSYAQSQAHVSSSASASSGRSNHSKPIKENKGPKITHTLSTKSQKKSRIKKLRAEIEELQAMKCHVKDQVASLVEEHAALTSQHGSLERRKKEAISLENAILAKKLGIEANMLEGEMSHRVSEVKNHQRQGYFLQQEISRRKGLIRTLLAEIADMDKKSGVRKKLIKIQKKEGIYSALLKVNSVVDDDEESEESETEKTPEPPPEPEKEEEKEIVKEEEEQQQQEEMEPEEEEDLLGGSQSIFSLMEMEGSGVIHTEDDSVREQQHTAEEEKEVEESPPSAEEKLATLPVFNADRVIDDVNALANNVATSTLSSTLEMIWFVMGAAEEVRPAKIATRDYVRDTLEAAKTNIACSRVLSETAVLDSLVGGFQLATIKRVKQDIRDAKQAFIAEVVDKVCTTGLTIAVNIITNEAVAKKDRARERIKVFSSELASKTVAGVFDTVLTAVAVKEELERLDRLRIEEEKKRIVVQEFANVIDDYIIGSIGAALYTVENKVTRYKEAVDSAKEHADPNSVGVVVHPAGAGFALAKMIKENNMMRLDMFDLDAHMGVKHTFPTVLASNDPNVSDLINEALRNTGDDFGILMYGKELGVIHQTEVEYEDWVFDARLIQDVDQIKLVALCSIPEFEKSVTFVLSKEQEKDLDNIRNPENFIRYILTQSLQE